jgi:hypothetical protein
MTSPPFRVETVPVRRTGRGPVVAALVLTLVAVSIVKPWSGADPGTADPSRDFASPGAVAVNPVVDAPADTSRAEASPAAAESAPLAPGQVVCGSSGWDLVTLGSFLRWTVRTLTAITPVEVGGPGDPSIPVLSLGESAVAGLGACAPSISPVAPGRASRIVEAWRRGLAGATTTTAATAPPDATMPGVAVPPGATAPSGATAPATAPATDGRTDTAATWERVTLAQLDPLPSGGPVATRLTPVSVTELFRPVPASQHGRCPPGGTSSSSPRRTWARTAGLASISARGSSAGKSAYVFARLRAEPA